MPSETKEKLWELVEKSGAELTTQQQEKLYKVLLGFADVLLSLSQNWEELINCNIAFPQRQITLSVYHREESRQPTRKRFTNSYKTC